MENFKAVYEDMGIQYIASSTKNDYILSVVKLANQAYAKELVSPLDYYRELFNKAPEGFIYAIDTITNQLIGYTIIIPLTSAGFEKTLKNGFTEDDLTIDDVIPFKKGTNHVYVFSIVIDKTYHNRAKLLVGMVNFFKEYATKLAIEGIFITRCSSLTYSPQGIKLCEIFKFEKIGQSVHGQLYYKDNFHKLFIDDESKEQVFRTFLKQKKERELEALKKD